MKTVFLMISRLLYDKGYTEYVETARIIRARYPDTEFQLLGNIDPSYPKAVPEAVVNQDCADGTIVYLALCPRCYSVDSKCRLYRSSILFRRTLTRANGSTGNGETNHCLRYSRMQGNRGTREKRISDSAPRHSRISRCCEQVPEPQLGYTKTNGILRKNKSRAGI